MQNTSWLNALKATSLQDAMGMTDRQYHRWLKSQAKEFGCYAAKDSLAHSMQGGTFYQRFRPDEDGEGWKLYGFVLGEEFADRYDVETTFELTDDEIWEFFDRFVAFGTGRGWDCSGRPFTQYIHWHRNPDGAISYVHKVALDV